MTKPLVVALTGATGVIYGVEMLKVLRDLDQEVHLILSDSAERNLKIETDITLGEVKKMADVVYNVKDVGAAPASGSFLTKGMVVVPCSMNSLASMAHGISDNLLLRTADVCLKEHRPLVIVPRETPLHSGHLENMLKVSRLGAMVLPPEPPFYLRPETIDDVVRYIVNRVLVGLGVEDALPDSDQYHPRTP